MKKLLMTVLFALTALSAHADQAIGQGQPLIIDVRTQAEWDTGHLENAVLIPHTQVANQIIEYTADPQQTIYVYCRSGNRAGYAVDILQELGYQKVFNLGSVAQAAETLNAQVVTE
ncbi:rhodanese-like domain-containing protein [Salinibius halmophilus]|uniref:rhodanese-like domain-containing protein n=1 Tax=Salinibius halmophilus TaxID=1853216 RepID=UPI000E671F96|nr:rhodanese-like domain-containing protein [Salinibius halmophilus]